jgi:hypothetical protein
MLEIFLIIAISKKIAAMLKEKGRGPTGFVILFVVMWFCGEVIGFVVGTIAHLAADPNALNNGFNWMAYLMGLAGAAIGGSIAYAIAAAMPAIERPDQAGYDDGDDDDYERDRRRRRRGVAEEGAFEEDRSEREDRR